MSVLEVVLWCSLGFIGILGSAMCSGLEVGLYSVNRVLVRVRAADNRHGRRARVLASLIDRQAQTLTSLLIWNNLFNYLGTLAITTIIASRGLSDGQMILVQVLALTPILLIFAESTPKELFRSNASVMMQRFAYIAEIMSKLMIWIPVVPLVLLVARGLSKLVGIDSFDTIRSARHHMGELLKYGSVEMSEAQVSLIDRALELENATVRSVMIPMKKAVTLRGGWTRNRSRTIAQLHSYSRFPVIAGRGHVIGVLDGMDLYLDGSLSESGSKSIDPLMVDPVRVRADISIRMALNEMKRSSAKLGIVTQDGRDIGIVTRLNLISPLMVDPENW